MNNPAAGWNVGLDPMDDPWTEGELHAYLADLDEDLEEARRHPNDREARHRLTMGLSTLAGIELPAGLGADIDKMLVTPKAAAMLLQRAIRIAERRLYDDQEEVAAVSKSIERLRAAIVPLSERLSGVEKPSPW